MSEDIMLDIVIVGAGGHGKEIAQLIRDINRQEPKWNLRGYLDDDLQKKETRLNGHKVLGTTELLSHESYRDIFVVVAIGNSELRKTMVMKLKNQFPSIRFPNLIHPTAVMGDESNLGEGVVVCALSLISTNVTLGEHVLVHYGSTIGHDTTIESFSTVLPGSNLSGNVKIGEIVSIGANATVLPGVEIGAYTSVGAGAVVTKTLPDNCTAVGIPAMPIKFRNKDHQFEQKGGSL